MQLPWDCVWRHLLCDGDNALDLLGKGASALGKGAVAVDLLGGAAAAPVWLALHGQRRAAAADLD